ncbi:AAA family ATPase [Vibrio parahaemolyticus]|uniref:AAA family ATPase n=3 Tax=Vibrio parahaemolyticus TaxID=670 RepID=UPI002361A504|nr:AAA family ATPase [Vibrio parahaemolyticus]EIZ1043744.1 AAA family ATPase [Vibrio parahaemolyticus]
MFKKVEINHWRQFERIEIDLGEKVTIITGSNGAGKTTILGVLGKTFGWDTRLLSTPAKDQESGLMRFFTGKWDSFFSKEEDQESWIEIGKVQYSDLNVSKVSVPKEAGSTYDLNFSEQQPVQGMHIPSHRPVFNYKEVESIPTKPKKKEDYFNEYNANVVDKFTNTAEWLKNISPNYLLKESLIGLATFGYGNSHVVANKEYAELFEGFQEILKIMLPATLGFKHLEIRIPEVVLVTESGEFSIDAASGGVASIIGIAWQIYMFSQNKENFVITIDEPENHLHPSMQRELIPNLSKAFSKAQFVIATHSPFIIGSSKKSQVYALTYNNENRIFSRKLDMIDKSGNAAKVLREVLGVPVTVPVWVEDEIKEVVKKYSEQGVDEGLFQRMRQELEERELQEFMPKAITLVVESLNDKA